MPHRGETQGAAQGAGQGETVAEGGPAPAPAHAVHWHGAWPLAACGLAWMGGVAGQLQQPVMWPAAQYMLLFSAGLAMMLPALAWPVARHALWLAPALALLAFGSTGWRGSDRLADRLDATLEGQDLVVTGTVAALPQAGPTGLRFTFEPDRATLAGRPVRLPATLALGWYDGFADESPLDDARADLRAGQRWRLPLRLKQPHGAMNPGSFDAELWWFEQGVGATGYVRVTRNGPRAELLGDGWAHPVERARQSIRDGIQRQVRDPRAAGVLAALVVGDQAAIERDDWELFRQTGIAHLVSISGLHITMFAWLAARLVGMAWRRSTRLMLMVPAPMAGRVGGLLLAAAYSMLAGWGVPAQRTLAMLAATVLLRAAGAQWPWLLVLLAAGVVVTALDPWALLQAGFWLSFFAVALLMVSEPVQAAPGRPGWRGAVLGQVKAQAVASIGLAPLAMVFFQQVSIVGLLANFIAIPLVTLLVTPLAMLGVLLPLLWSLAAAVVQAGIWGLGLLAQWPWAVWTAAAAPPWALVLGLAGAALAVMPLPWSLRLAALPLWLPLLAPPVDRPGHGSVEALAVDIGQGTAVLLRTRHHLLVYDAGPQYARDSDAGQRVLLPLLRHRGERDIDLLMLSHRDSDHVGGAASLLANWPVRAMSTSLETGHPLLVPDPPGHPPHTRCAAGQAWDWDGVHFAVLHPTPADFDTMRKPNDVSCVLKVTDTAGRSLLLTGDIEAPQEAALLARDPLALASTVLLAPHHGSRTSSTPAFLRAVAPPLAVVQAGYRSRFGHPAPDVVARYQGQGIAVARSDRCGALHWQDGRVDCERDLRRRYWHWQAPAVPDER